MRPAACALIAAFVILAVTSLWHDSQTSDEAIHIAAGFAHLTRADFAINPEHPPLAKEIAALPLLGMGVSLPVGEPAWADAHRSGFQLPLGESFLYRNSVPFPVMLRAARLPIVVLGALTCLVIFVFSKRLFGWQGGLVSLALAALCPNLLAHSRLVTTDLAVSFFLLLALYRLWLFLMHPTDMNALLAGAAAGATLASKFSAVMVLPAMVLVLMAAPSPSVPRRAKVFVLMAAAALGVLLSSYAVVGWPHYVAGIKGVFETVTGGTEAFLLGSFSTSGWWYYYPAVMLMKTPVPSLICIGLTVAIMLSAGGRKRLRDLAVLWIPLAVFFLASLASARNVGLRHVLPVYPILYVLCGSVAGLPWLAPLWIRAAAAGLLVAWQAGAALFIHPAYLAYINELWGGPSNAPRLVSDSNVDWGQDFVRLKQLMDREGAGEILLGYYGNQDPALYGITWQNLPGAGHINPPPGHLVSGERVLAAVSVMTLQGMFSRNKDEYAFLRSREPLARVGYSLYVYDLTGDRAAFEWLAGLYGARKMAAQERWARDRLAKL